jgi:hypothetical protein
MGYAEGRHTTFHHCWHYHLGADKSLQGAAWRSLARTPPDHPPGLCRDGGHDWRTRLWRTFSGGDPFDIARVIQYHKSQKFTLLFKLWIVSNVPLRQS